MERLRVVNEIDVELLVARQGLVRARGHACSRLRIWELYARRPSADVGHRHRKVVVGGRAAVAVLAAASRLIRTRAQAAQVRGLVVLLCAELV